MAKIKWLSGVLTDCLSKWRYSWVFDRTSHTIACQTQPWSSVAGHCCIIGKSSSGGGFNSDGGGLGSHSNNNKAIISVDVIVKMRRENTGAEAKKHTKELGSHSHKYTHTHLSHSKLQQNGVLAGVISMKVCSCCFWETYRILRNIFKFLVIHYAVSSYII